MSKRPRVTRNSTGVVSFSSDFSSAETRVKLGIDLRKRLPLKAHAGWGPPRSGRDPIGILKKSSRGRVKRLIPIRYERMRRNAFAFLRGSADIMAHDLSLVPHTGIQAQLCGDCHLANFGTFATPERNVIFDINDFDETLGAPFEWDVKRLAASIFIAGLGIGLSPDDCSGFVRSAVRSYRKAIRDFARMPILEQWYARADTDIIRSIAPDVTLEKAGRTPRGKTRSTCVDNVDLEVSGVTADRARIVDNPPLIYHPPEKWHLEEQLVKALGEYRKSLPPERRILYDRYRLDDISIKVVGVGSVGTRCLILLYGARPDDRLILQVKEAKNSVLEPYAGKGKYDHQGERVVVGQRIIQAASDIFLGWMTDKKDGTQYYVRQLRDMKYSANVDNMSPGQMCQYAMLCGWTLARAHAKGGDAPMISGYLGDGDDFDIAIGEFAREYAGQINADYGEFLNAIRSGRLDTKLELPKQAT